MSIMYLTGHVLDMIKLLPDNYVHCCVTSPPYFGLRAYDGGKDIVWGGSPDCQHQWAIERTARPNSSGGLASEKQRSMRGSHSVDYKDRATYASVCSFCGAWRGQLGAEPTIDLYISHLVEIFREVRRVLRPDGQFWLNIGDSAVGGKGQSGSRDADYQEARYQNGVTLERNHHQMGGQGQTRPLDDRASLRASGLKPLDTCLIPFRLALALQNDGWYVRSDCIWSKKNCMPRSYQGWRWEQHRIKIKDRGISKAGIDKQEVLGSGNPHASRDGYESVWQDCPGCPKCLPNSGLVLRKGSWSPTESHEYIFQLVKSTPYFADREAVKEPLSLATMPRVMRGNSDNHKYVDGAPGQTPNSINKPREHGDGYSAVDPSGRNLRSVWEFSTQGFKGAHFAVFPPKLVEIAVKASTSEYGVCDKCGSQWARVVDKGRTTGRTSINGQGSGELGKSVRFGDSHVTLSGFRPTCTCNSGVSKPIILDPFGGAGTTSVVAERINCDSIYIDSSAEYTELARQRIAEDERKRLDEFIKRAKSNGKNTRKTS